MTLNFNELEIADEHRAKLIRDQRDALRDATGRLRLAVWRALDQGATYSDLRPHTRVGEDTLSAFVRGWRARRHAERVLAEAGVPAGDHPTIGATLMLTGGVKIGLGLGAIPSFDDDDVELDRKAWGRLWDKAVDALRQAGFEVVEQDRDDILGVTATATPPEHILAGKQRAEAGQA